MRTPLKRERQSFGCLAYPYIVPVKMHIAAEGGVDLA